MNALHQDARRNVREFEAFLTGEARLLDEREFEAWSELFVPDGYYWAPARPDQADPWSEVSLMFDDRQVMANRIQRLRHPKLYAQLPASRTVRQVSNVELLQIDEASGDFEIGSVFLMFEHRPTLPSPVERVFAGRYRHRLRRQDDTFRIVWKKAVLVNCDAAFEPLFLYF